MEDSVEQPTGHATPERSFASRLETELVPTWESDIEDWFSDFISNAENLGLPVHRLVLRLAVPSRLSRLMPALTPPSEAERRLCETTLTFVARPGTKDAEALSAAKERWNAIADEMEEDVYCDPEANFLRVLFEPAESPGDLKEMAWGLALDPDEIRSGTAELTSWLRGERDPAEARLVEMIERRELSR